VTTRKQKHFIHKFITQYIGGGMRLEELEQKLTTLTDLEEIKQLHQRYIDLMDNLQYEEVLNLFTEDGTAEIRQSGVKRGKKELAEIYVDFLGKGRANKRFEGHFAVHPNISLDGDTAKGTWLIYMLFSKPNIQWVQGLNEAEYRKEKGTWKISKLKFTRTLASDPTLYP